MSDETDRIVSLKFLITQINRNGTVAHRFQILFSYGPGLLTRVLEG